ncbi:MAG: cyclase family protein [Elusimicrobiota bacterium]|nr:cyclase family protein [Elusimicrobiota bacterium]
MPRIIDLSFPIHEGMTTFPSHWHPLVEVSQLGRHGIEDRESRKLVIGTHTGTHVDAPLHFVRGGTTIDKLPLDLMTGPASLVDLPSRPKEEVGLPALKAALKGKKPARRLLLRWRWSRHWGTMRYYTEAPYLSVEACRWLVASGVKLLGTDTPSVDCHDHGWRTANDAPNHRAMLGRGLFLIEYLNDLDKLRKTTFELTVAPLNILGADGAPARVLAVER